MMTITPDFSIHIHLFTLVTGLRIADILALIQKLNGEHADAPTEAAL